LSIALGVLSFPALVANADSSTEPSLAQNQRVFVCGHSFHVGIAKILPEMAQAAGLTNFASAGVEFIGGSTTLQHWDLPDKKSKAKAALREGKVDVLTLSPIPRKLIPDPGIDKFTKLGLEKNPQLRVFVQESWSAWDEAKDPTAFKKEQRDRTPLAEMRAAKAVWEGKVESQVKALNESLGRQVVFIIPTWVAVQTLRERVAADKVPGIAHQTELFRDDIGHPEPPVAVLNAYCHFAAIFRRSPVGLPVPTALKHYPHAEDLNRLLQQLAWDAVSSHPMSGVNQKPSGELPASKPGAPAIQAGAVEPQRL